MGKIISVLNQKGGVGKTTTAINLGGALLQKGYKVLLIDSDSQANLTESLGISADLPKTFYGAMKKEYDLPILQHPDGFHIVPSCIDVSALDIELINEYAREHILSKLINTCKANYDFIIIDCPPALSLSSINALTASDFLLIPVQAHYLALRGMSKLLETVNKVKSSGLNPNLKIVGALITQYEGTILNKEVAENVRKTFQGKVFGTVIRKIIALAEAPTTGQDIFHYSAKSQGAEDYMNFCIEFLNEIKDGKKEL